MAYSNWPLVIIRSRVRFQVTFHVTTRRQNPEDQDLNLFIYESVSKSFRTGRLERELQMVQPSATRCSSKAISWVSLVSFAAITLCVASQRVFIVVVYFVMTQSGNFWIHPRVMSFLWIYFPAHTNFLLFTGLTPHSDGVLYLTEENTTEWAVFSSGYCL